MIEGANVSFTHMGLHIDLNSSVHSSRAPFPAVCIWAGGQQAACCFHRQGSAWLACSLLLWHFLSLSRVLPSFRRENCIVMQRDGLHSYRSQNPTAVWKEGSLESWAQFCIAGSLWSEALLQMGSLGMHMDLLWLPLLGALSVQNVAFRCLCSGEGSGFRDSQLWLTGDGHFN